MTRAQLAGSRIAATVTLLAVALQPPLFVQMTLAYPSGRVRDRIDRSFRDPRLCRRRCLADPACAVLRFPLSRLLARRPIGAVHRHDPDLTVVGEMFESLFIALGLVFVALIVRRTATAPPGARRTMVPLALAGFFTITQFILFRVASLTDFDQAFTTLDWLDTRDDAGCADGDLCRDLRRSAALAGRSATSWSGSARRGRGRSVRLLGVRSAIRRSSSDCGCPTAASSSMRTATGSMSITTGRVIAR